MAKNTGRGSRIAAQKPDRGNTNMWTRPSPSSGVFAEMKAEGGKFKNQKSH